MPPSLQSANGAAPKGQQRIGHTAGALSTQNILLFIVALRIVNSLSIQTFFQPDEYFQSLEPAWQMAFGKESGAWITWVHMSLNAI
jgi:phosphatidylinositol glycan class B